MLSPDSPGVRIPPPLFFVAAFGIGLGIDAFLPGTLTLPHLFPMFGTVTMAISLTLAVLAFVALRSAGTEVRPDRPATSLVRNGPYRASRHPMYLALVLLYLGLAMALRSGWPIVTLPLALLAVEFLAIEPEERYLLRRFGDEYREYQQRVGRWF